MRVQLPQESSAALRAQAILGPNMPIASAFHNVAAHKLATDEEIDCHVLVFGDDKATRARVIRLATLCGLRGIHGGALANSVAASRAAARARPAQRGDSRGRVGGCRGGRSMHPILGKLNKSGL
jgi:predicted dinucleotide-binding enzyme